MTTVVRTDRAAINFYELTDRLGIESGWAVAPRFALVRACAIRKCRECDDPEACRAWIKAATGVLTGPPKGCPNADLFVELLYDRPAMSRRDID